MYNRYFIFFSDVLLTDLFVKKGWFYNASNCHIIKLIKPIKFLALNIFHKKHCFGV